ncbi:ABC-type transport system involved in cytochrome c biogenesis ATPase subunit [Lachnotalea glycerini]|uniref:ABC-type transport system involved in cytochrome c biogenesis ATPase subunit n=1 Tax=Lachnotalea glycerini TaxID=1763509 RepID=A0A318EPC9_9FIRM|nr:AAA family ATPase [Lachnotalea glycerini]PXV87826.1 ABC-type transport system involved in cytochrome c biogenesis ATPase subunit [Lachnotalea glycerini]
MKIKSVSIKNLGFISKLDLEFAFDKINVIQGKNGSGKTTVLAAIYSMFQESEILNYKDNDNDAIIEITIQDEDKTNRIKKRYHCGKSIIEVKSFQEMNRLVKIKKEKVFLLSAESLRDKFWLSDEKVKSAIDFFGRLKIEDTIVDSVLIELLENDKSFRYMSIGQQIYFGILSVLSYVPSDSVLLVDDLFGYLDMCTIESIVRVMKKITNIQFVLTSHFSSSSKLLDCEMIDLTPEKSNNDYEQPNFQYNRFFNHEVKKKLFSDNNNKPIISKPFIKYKRGMEIEDIENRNIEYKEIKGNNPCNTIIDVSEIYINAFLNSWVTGSGTIKWGISDCGIVIGVELSKVDKDTIIRKLAERIGQMRPYISQDLVQIIFEDIIENGYIIPGFYIVEIIIEPFQIWDLVSTSKDEVYIKTEGGKKRLNSYEIQQELKRRNKLS